MSTDTLSTEILNEMRGWVSDCVWGDLEPEEIDELTDDQIMRGVARRYDGGIAQFIADVA